MSVVYNPGELQFGCLADYVVLGPKNGKPEKHWAGPDDYEVNYRRLQERLKAQSSSIASTIALAGPFNRTETEGPVVRHQRQGRGRAEPWRHR